MKKDLKLLHFVIIAIGIGLLWVGTIIFRYSGICEAIVSPIIHSSDINPPDERLANTQEENPDTMAWITIPGTNIDAPVQQYGDNDYYLRRDEKGTEDYHGCLYADYACRMDSAVKVSRNLIFYGHTFTDEDYTGGFEDLHKYRVFEFGQENPYIYVSLADEKLTYQIFSVWVCDANADTDCIQADPAPAAARRARGRTPALPQPPAPRPQKHPRTPPPRPTGAVFAWHTPPLHPNFMRFFCFL